MHAVTDGRATGRQKLSVAEAQKDARIDLLDSAGVSVVSAEQNVDYGTGLRRRRDVDGRKVRLRQHDNKHSASAAHAASV